MNKMKKIQLVGYICLFAAIPILIASKEIPRNTIIDSALGALHVFAALILITGMFYYYFNMMTNRIEMRKNHKIFRPYIIGGGVYLLGAITMIAIYYYG